MTDEVVQTPPVETPPAPVATAPTPAPAPAPVEPTPVVAPISGFEPTGDAGIDLALSFFGKLGIKESDPEIVEAGRGNFDYLKAKLASLGAKAEGWEQYLTLAETGHKNFTAAQEQALQTRIKTVHDAVGGEANWEAIQTWAEKEGEPAELAQIKAGIKQGGVVATAVAQFLAAKYAEASGTTLEAADPVGHQANVTPGAPLTAQSYQSEVQALVRKYGSEGVQSSPEYAALRQKYARLNG